MQVCIALADAAVSVSDSSTGELLNARQVADRLSLSSPQKAVEAVQQTAYQLRRGQVVNNTTIDRQRHEQLAGVRDLGQAGMQWPDQDAMSEIPGEPSTAYAVMAQHDASLAIGQATSTPTLADDGDASAARVTALGARGSGVSQGRGSLDPHQATQVAIAASAMTHQRLREVHTMVDQVAAQRATQPAASTSRDGVTARQDAPRYADRSDYVSPTTGTDAPVTRGG